ncbi:MAG: universal stress protein [Bryobacteraceae bacterium]
MVLQVLDLNQELTMLSVSRILLPMDFSDRCMGMLPYARAVAAKYGAELILLHVENEDELAKVGRERHQDIDVRRVLYDGDPADVIVGFVKSEKIDLIAMPTHGYGVFRRFLIGSVTAKVLHDVSCPVLTGVHMEEQPAPSLAEFSNVLCAIDLGAQSADVLKWATQLATEFHAQFGVVHALPPLSPGLELLFASDWRAEVANMARKDVETLVSAIGPGAAAVYIQEGEPAKTVCSFAKAMGADLLVIGRGPRDRVGGRLTTHSYAVIRQSPCPVISI